MDNREVNNTDYISASECKKLLLLRNAMKKEGIDTYLIPSSDPHLGEYIPDHWQIIKWLTGFSGSAATVVVTDAFAGLWTDSRYFIQAERQLSGSGFKCIKPGTSKSNDYLDFIYENSGNGNKIGIDGRIFPIAQFIKLEKRLEKLQVLIDTGCDLISPLWNDRPVLPLSLAFDHPPEFSGKERSGKISEVREEMRKRNADFHLLSSNDDIAWILNIRGNDLKYSPLLLSYALIGEKQILLFMDEQKIPLKLASEFDNLGVVLLPYDEIIEIVPAVTEGFSVLLNPVITSVSLYSSISKKSKIIEDLTIPARLKAIKNKTEIENIGRVMIKDGIALTKFLYWFDSNNGKMPISEGMLSHKLFEFRSQQKDFLCHSFPPIVAFNENSALPHYTPIGFPGWLKSAVVIRREAPAPHW
jgi:Xaa-Pro aminopeptidase